MQPSTHRLKNGQTLVIREAMAVDAKAVIFDEPTASMTDAEKIVLFDIINDLRSQGVLPHLLRVEMGGNPEQCDKS